MAHPAHVPESYGSGVVIDGAGLLLTNYHVVQGAVKIYVRLKEGRSRNDCTPAAIASHCAKHLAPFKVPRYFEYVEDFPRTSSRKIAKKAS